jgi:HD-GYP domain-containing protein (c-di-GMP phosphodiesterase class II)
MTRLSKFIRSLFSFRNPTLWVLLPLAYYVYLRITPSQDILLALPVHHFYIVSITSLIALVISIIVGLVGVRQRNLQVIYVSLAFISLAAFFSAHGLATPGFILDANKVVGVAAQLSVLTMSFWLLVSALPTESRFSGWLAKRANILLPLWTPAIVIVGILALRNPLLANFIPVTQAPLRYFVGAMTLLIAGWAGYRYWQSYRYSNFPFQLAIAYVGGWIAVSQIIITTGVTFYLSWWVYHVLLLLSVIFAVVGLVIQYRRGDSIVRSILGLFSSDPHERLAAGISPSVRQLILSVEKRDPYTAGHSNRVAQGAFDLGSALKLSPEDLRVLAQGGVVHDVGKLEVPDEILNKPGPLNAEERKAIEQHTVIGYELCARLGFMSPELAVIRSHHERLDGRGYPDGLKAQQIPQLVRIMSVIDVWDALTSARAYRPAWPEAEALNYLTENSGSQFDASLVNTWVNLVQGRNGKTKSTKK